MYKWYKTERENWKKKKSNSVYVIDQYKKNNNIRIELPYIY